MGTDRILGTRLGTRKNNLYLIIKVYRDISRSFDSPHLHHIRVSSVIIETYN